MIRMLLLAIMLAMPVQSVGQEIKLTEPALQNSSVPTVKDLATRVDENAARLDEVESRVEEIENKLASVGSVEVDITEADPAPVPSPPPSPPLIADQPIDYTAEPAFISTGPPVASYGCQGTRLSNVYRAPTRSLLTSTSVKTISYGSSGTSYTPRPLSSVYRPPAVRATSYVQSPQTRLRLTRVPVVPKTPPVAPRATGVARTEIVQAPVYRTTTELRCPGGVCPPPRVARLRRR